MIIVRPSLSSKTGIVDGFFEAGLASLEAHTAYLSAFGEQHDVEAVLECFARMAGSSNRREAGDLVRGLPGQSAVMQAAVYRRTGDPSVLSIENVDTTSPSAGRAG